MGLKMGFMFTNLKDISKLESGKFVIGSVCFNLKNMLSDCISSLQLRAYEKKLKFEMYYESDLNTKVMGDPTRIRQVLINLIGNAIKFTEKGKISVLISKQKSLHHS